MLAPGGVERVQQSRRGRVLAHGPVRGVRDEVCSEPQTRRVHDEHDPEQTPIGERDVPQVLSRDPLRVAEVRLVPLRDSALGVESRGDAACGEALSRDGACLFILGVGRGELGGGLDEEIQRPREHGHPRHDHKREFPGKVESHGEAAHAGERRLHELAHLFRGSVLKDLHLLARGRAQLTSLGRVEERDVLRHHGLQICPAHVARAARCGPPDEAEARGEGNAEHKRDSDHEHNRVLRRLLNVGHGCGGVQELSEGNVDARKSHAANHAEEDPHT